jgi:hypothetical protein
VARVCVVGCPMLNSGLRKRKGMACIPATAAPGGRWVAGTYVSVWRQLCDAVWQQELEDPLFRRAVELAKANQLRPDVHWLQREAWRDCIRSWWSSVRDCYVDPTEIPHDWIVAQCEWEPERDSSLNPERRAATWARAEALIETGAYWPLHLDAPHLVRAQFETLREWVPTAVAEREPTSRRGTRRRIG